jgi:two-component system chemotaxis sensor kinase CheA
VEEQDPDVLREFLVESYENLGRLDQELVELENHPQDKSLLASIFRTIHTIKGTCGFLGFATLEKITHQAESVLSQLRDGQRNLTPALITLILETVDAVRKVLASIEASGQEGSEPFDALTAKLRAAAQNLPEAPPQPAPMSAPAIPQPVTNAVPPAEAAPDEDESKSSSISDANIRVAVGLLDKLMDLVGELVLARNQILQYNTEREDAALNATSQRLNLITTELQGGVMKTRMQPIGVVWNKLPRVVRDTAVAVGKQIRVEMDGAETELDRTIIEAIKDPLVHLVRNACDHGIELPEVRTKVGKPAQGRLSLRAYHEGGQVNIEISDDGAGIDVARIKQKAIEKGLLRIEQAEKLTEKEELNLIFRPGFSTVEKVTNLSGRGVGMDVVKSHIERIGGTVDIFSRPGEGCTIKLKIPLTLAIIPGLVVTSGGERFVIPQVSLLELIRLEGDSIEKQIENVHGTPVYRRRGTLLPVAYLNRVLGLSSPRENEAINLVVLQAEDRQFGLVVDGINDTQEIVVKPLGKQLKGLSVYAGATIMGDGRVDLILDVLGIGQCSGVLAESRDEETRAYTGQKARAGNELQRLLLFRAGSFDRLAVPLSLVARLEEFPLSSIEHAGGSRVVQYRERILPLISLDAVLEAEPPDPVQADPVQVIVFNDGDRAVGLVVDQILDVVEESVTVRQKTNRQGLLGSAVIGKQVADFLDLNFVIRTAAKDWFQPNSEPEGALQVLVVEASPFSRGLIRSGLDMAGYRVLEAANAAEAIHRLENDPVDIVLAALNLPPDGSSALFDAMHLRPEWEAIPVVALLDTPEQAGTPSGPGRNFQDCQVKFDREAMLGSVARLAAAVAAVDKAPLCAPGRDR